MSQLSLAKIICCEECDAIYKKIELTAGEQAYCICCGAELYRQPTNLLTLFVLTLTSLIVFVIANSLPIIRVELQGQFSQTTLLGAISTIFHSKFPFISVVVLITTFIVPLLDLLLLIIVLFFICFLKIRPFFLISLLKILFLFRTWGMLEVFLIGILITIVKLMMMVVVVPGIALWAFVILSILVVNITSVTSEELWDAIERELS